MSGPRPPSLWRTTVLPAEHGSWAFVLEPPLFGLMWGPSWAGLFAVLSVAFGFVAYRPLRLASRDLRAHKAYPRTRFGLVVGGCFLGAAMATAAGAIGLSGWRLLEPLGLTLLLAAAFGVVDAKSRPGNLARELVGATVTTPLVALGLLGHAPHLGDWIAVMLAGGAIVVAKSWGAILYVRARLPGPEATSASRMVAVVAALAGLALGAAWLRQGEPPYLIAGFALLAVRTGYGLSPFAASRPAKQVGFQELGYSLAFYILAALAFARAPVVGPA